jgi:DNA-binding beta-propeller fold protein YncE
MSQARPHAWFAFAILFTASTGPVLAQPQANAPPAQFLKTNTAVGYTVDPAWPQRPESVAPWEAMSSIAIDAQGNVWTLNRGLDPVQVYDASGKFLRTWGRGTITKPHHLRIDRNGDIWITDIAHHVIQKFSPGGELLLTIGTPDKPGVDETHFDKPTDVAIASSGDVYISDGYGNNRVVQCDAQGKFIRAWGKLGVAPGEFNLPHSIVIDSNDRVYVADRNNVRVQVFDSTGKFLDQWTDLMVPWGLSITKDNDLWVCGSSPMLWWTEGQHVIPLGCPPKDQLFMRFSTDGRVRHVWSVPKAMDGFERPGELNWVHTLVADAQGNLYAGDIMGKRVQKFVRIEPSK